MVDVSRFQFSRAIAVARKRLDEASKVGLSTEKVGPYL